MEENGFGHLLKLKKIRNRDTFLDYFWTEIMNLLEGKNWIFNFFTIAALTVGAGYVITSDGFVAHTDQVRFSDLSDADIDMILAVKNEMHEAKIRAN